MSKLNNYEQLEIISNKIKKYIDESVLYSQEITDNNISVYIDTTKKEIYNLLASNYTTFETFNNYSDALSTSFQLLQYGTNLKLENLSNNLDDVYYEFSDFKKTINRNMAFDPVSMTIRQKDSPYSFTVSEKEISFIEDKEKIGRIVNDEWTMNNVDVRESFTLGPFKFINKENGHLSFVWDDKGNIVNYDYSYPNVTNNNNRTHTAYLYEKLEEGKTYTIEICGTVPKTSNDDRWVVFCDNASEWTVNLREEFFKKGVGVKSFVAPANTDNFVLCMNPIQDRYNTISYVKIYEGDDYWRDVYNIISYNNVYNSVFKYHYTPSAGYKSINTYVYGYFEKDTVYNFTCETDASWGNVDGVDTVHMYLINDDETKTVALPSGDHTFTMPEKGRWTLCFKILKDGAQHSFWDAKITKLGMTYEIYEDQELTGNEIDQ